jgi:hypothetical protein
MSTTQTLRWTRTTLPDGDKAIAYGPLTVFKVGNVGGYSVRHTLSCLMAHRGHWFDKQSQAKAYAEGLLAIPGAMDYMEAVQADGSVKPFPNEDAIKAAMDSYSRANRPK